MINLHINCPNIRDIPNNQIPLQKVGDYWGFDTCSVTVQYTETVAVFKVSSEVIKCPTIGAASFGQSPYVARLLPVRGVVGHNIDRRIMHYQCIPHAPPRLFFGGTCTVLTCGGMNLTVICCPGRTPARGMVNLCTCPRGGAPSPALAILVF